jgi:hypothetical protein
MRNAILLLISTILCVSGLVTSLAQSASSRRKQPAVREPFTLHLKLDKDHYSDIHYDRQPYVSENEVYLVSGDKFGVNLVVKNDRVVEVQYQPEAKQADVVFGFEQPKELQNGIGMALTIDNKTKRTVSMEALMSIPGKKDVFKTSILPVRAGKSGLESWPHPISQLVLGNLQLTSHLSSGEEVTFLYFDSAPLALGNSTSNELPLRFSAYLEGPSRPRPADIQN